MLWELFRRTPIDIIRRRYPDSTVTTTAKKNIFKITKHNTPTYIVKYFTNKEQFNKEAGIIRSLPDWWGLKCVDTFSVGNRHFIVTEEIPNIPWSSYSNCNTCDVADFLYSQIDWLFEKRITHRGLHLGNVLLERGGKRAIIVDFEDCVLYSSDSELYYTYKESFKHFPHALMHMMYRLLHQYTVIVWNRCH